MRAFAMKRFVAAVLGFQVMHTHAITSPLMRDVSNAELDAARLTSASKHENGVEVQAAELVAEGAVLEEMVHENEDAECQDSCSTECQECGQFCDAKSPAADDKKCYTCAMKETDHCKDCLACHENAKDWDPSSLLELQPKAKESGIAGSQAHESGSLQCSNDYGKLCRCAKDTCRHSWSCGRLVAGDCSAHHKYWCKRDVQWGCFWSGHWFHGQNPCESTLNQMAHKVCYGFMLAQDKEKNESKTEEDESTQGGDDTAGLDEALSGKRSC